MRVRSSILTQHTKTPLTLRSNKIGLGTEVSRLLYNVRIPASSAVFGKPIRHPNNQIMSSCSRGIFTAASEFLSKLCEQVTGQSLPDYWKKGSGSPHHEAALRNRIVIWEHIEPLLAQQKIENESQGLKLSVLELASGTGAHVEYFAPKNAAIHWQQTDMDVANTVPITGQDGAPLANVAKPQIIDLCKISDPEVLKNCTAKLDSGGRGPRTFDVVYASNLTHIAPFSATENIFRHVLPCIKPKLFILYGPFKQNGEFTTESNKDFDGKLREKDPGYGLRDLEKVQELALRYAKMDLKTVKEMPANNFLLVFEPMWKAQGSTTF